MTVANTLLSDIEAFLSESGMGASYFGKLTANSTALVSRLRSGGGIQPATESKIRKFMSAHVRKERKATVAKPVRKKAPARPASGYIIPTAYAPPAKEMGIRVYTRPDGISLSYLPSLYGERAQ